MRLIDIDSQFIASLFPDHHPDYQTFNLDDAYDRGWEDALDNIEDAPTIDAVPVVRCRECKYYEVDAGWTDGRACLMHHHRTTACRPDDFCSRGERKEAAHEISE